LRTTVSDLSFGEVAADECRIIYVKVLKKSTLRLHKWYEKDRIGQTLINSNSNDTAISESVGSSNTRNGLALATSRGTLCGKFSLEGVFASPRIESSPSHGVQQNLSFRITNIWQVLLNLDRRLLDHHVAHSLVGR
jgi:hypothetical protein